MNETEACTGQPLTCQWQHALLMHCVRIVTLCPPAPAMRSWFCLLTAKTASASGRSATEARCVFYMSFDVCFMPNAVCDAGFWTITGHPVDTSNRRRLLEVPLPNPGCWPCSEATTTAGRETAGNNFTAACTVCARGFYTLTGQTVDGCCTACDADEALGLTTASSGTAGADAAAACTGAVVVQTRFKHVSTPDPATCCQADHAKALLSFCSVCGLCLQFASAGGNKEPLLGPVCVVRKAPTLRPGAHAFPALWAPPQAVTPLLVTPQQVYAQVCGSLWMLCALREHSPKQTSTQ